MKNRIRIALIAAIVAQACAADDILSAYQEALENDTEYGAARAQFAAVEQRVPQSFAALLPSIALTANSASNNSDSRTYGRQSYNSNAWAVRLTQPLLRWDSKIEYDQTKMLVEQARAELEIARQDLVVRLAQAYFDVLYAQDALVSIESERAAISEQLAAANRRFELGTASITDVRDAKARFDIVSAQQIAARNDLAAKGEALRAITNRYPGTLAALADGVHLHEPSPNDIEAWVNSAVTDGLAVVAGQAAVGIARMETKKARAGHLPKIDLTASYGETNSGTITTLNTDLDEHSVGVQFSLPLYSGGATVARQRETAKLLDKAMAELDGARRTSALHARQAFLNGSAGLAQVLALEEALKSAETALAANQRGLELGVRANIDVLNARQQLAETQRDLARARYETLLSLLRLKAAAGRLGEADVQEINALLAAR